MFPDVEKPLLGLQLRQAALDLATQVLDVVATDDPAEQQDMLRRAAVNCIRTRLLLHLTRDLDHLPSDEIAELLADVDAIDADVARARRTRKH
jgi:hypothetical protein